MTGLTSAFNSLLTFFSTIITNLFSGEWSELLPYMLLGVAISVCLVACKFIRSVIWGR